ncbi:MAG: CRISPR-associated CARF protein Csa3 [Desulfurococcales archaeon]|nr:CRISPR-associated CARF protein Csa3 [Desulfurococcales archaeon]
MGKAFIITLGFDSSVVLRAISKHGINSNDQIILITSTTPHPKAENAINETVKFIGKIEKNITVETLRVEEHDFTKTVRTIYNKIGNLKKRKREIIIDISGGPRIIGLASYVAAGLNGIHTVNITTETQSRNIALPVIVDPIEIQKPTPRQLELLKTLPARPSDIARKMHITRSAVSKMIKTLAKKGLIERKGKTITPNKKGELILKISQKPSIL